MKKDDAKKRKKFHLSRYNFYKKKEEEAKKVENRIGFKFGKQ